MAQKNNYDKTLIVLAHLLGFLTGFIGALIILLSTKDENAKKHARVALNWQFSLLIYYAVSIVLMFVLIGFVLIFVLAILNVVFVVMASVKASEDKLWFYPLSIQFFKVQ